MFTKPEVRGADRSRRLHKALTLPSDRHLRTITETLRDCAITPQDVDNARAIFGPDLGDLKGKTNIIKSVPVAIKEPRMPQSVLDRLKSVHVHAGICFVNGIGFVVSIIERLKFCTSEAVGSRTDDVFVAVLKKIQATYRRGGFQVNVVSVNGQFSSAGGRIRDESLMDVNLLAAGEHVPVIQIHILRLKEGVRGMYNTLPFDKKLMIPARMIIEMVHAKTFQKNAVPVLVGVSAVVSPREMVTGQLIHYYRHFCLLFGQYVQTHEENDNTMKARTIGTISMRPTGASQGGYIFFRLDTGRLITQYHWTQTVMPEQVIQLVDFLARRDDRVGIQFTTAPVRGSTTGVMRQTVTAAHPQRQ